MYSGEVYREEVYGEEVYREEVYREEVYREKVYREEVYREEVYREEVYRGEVKGTWLPSNRSRWSNNDDEQAQYEPYKGSISAPVVDSVPRVAVEVAVAAEVVALVRQDGGITSTRISSSPVLPLTAAAAASAAASAAAASALPSILSSLASGC